MPAGKIAICWYVPTHSISPMACSTLKYMPFWTHRCVGNVNIIDSENGLTPGWRQAIIGTNVGILLIGPLRTNFSEILIEIKTCLFKKEHLEVSSVKWRPFCLGLNVLNVTSHYPGLGGEGKPTTTYVCLNWIIVKSFHWNFIEIHTFWFKETYMKVWSSKCEPPDSGANMLNTSERITALTNHKPHMISVAQTWLPYSDFFYWYYAILSRQCN